MNLLLVPSRADKDLEDLVQWPPFLLASKVWCLLSSCFILSTFFQIVSVNFLNWVRFIWLLFRFQLHWIWLKIVMGEVVSWWKDWMMTLTCAVQFVSVMLPAKALSIIWFWVKRKKRKSTIKNVYSNIYFCWRFYFALWDSMCSKNAKWRGNKVIKPPPLFVVDYHIVPIFHFWKRMSHDKH